MKLNRKQVPLFVGLCVVTLVMLGYAAFTLLGGGAAQPAAAGTTPVAATNPVLETPTAAKPALPTLTPSFRPDPFRPAMMPEGARPQPAAVRPRGPVTVAVHETLPAFPPPTLEPAPWTPPAPPTVVHKSAAVTPAPSSAPGSPSAAPAQTKPSFTLTGILEGDNRVAILRLSDTQRQVVQEKDRVAEHYVVDEITPNAVVLVSGNERWRLFLDN
jgi:hypothetical protein